MYVNIAGHQIGEGKKAFVVAELSGNHCQDINIAKQLIREAAKSGVDAIKLQTYRADTITLNSDLPDFQVSEEGSLWRGETLHGLYSKAYTPWEWHRELFDLANELGLVAFSSPFDETAVDFLEALNVPCYKIASFELNHTPLLEAVAHTGKPIILSTGMAEIEEISEALEVLRSNGTSEIVLLKCTSTYPAPSSEANLAVIADMKSQFSVPVGLSDHARGIGVSLTGIALGACLIERHLYLPEYADAVDAGFSSTPAEFEVLCREALNVRDCIGSVRYGPSDSEKNSLKYRRSLYICRDMRQGEMIAETDVKVVRPGFGMHPKNLKKVVGRVLANDKPANTPLAETDLK
jgi:pseudaminic acid synthase